MNDIQTPSGGLPQKRPGLVTASGVIGIVFCSIGIVTSLWTLIAMLVFGGPQQMIQGFRGLYSGQAAELYDGMMAVASKYFPFTYSVGGIYFVTVILGLIGGILLLRSKARGLFLTRLYAVISLVVVTVNTVWTVFYLSEISVVMNNFFTQADLPRGGRMMTSGIVNMSMYIGFILGIFYTYSWPVLALVFLSRKSVKEYFRNK